MIQTFLKVLPSFQTSLFINKLKRFEIYPFEHDVATFHQNFVPRNSIKSTGEFCLVWNIWKALLWLFFEFWSFKKVSESISWFPNKFRENFEKREFIVLSVMVVCWFSSSLLLAELLRKFFNSNVNYIEVITAWKYFTWDQQRSSHPLKKYFTTKFHYQVC